MNEDQEKKRAVEHNREEVMLDESLSHGAARLWFLISCLVSGRDEILISRVLLAQKLGCSLVRVGVWLDELKSRQWIAFNPSEKMPRLRVLNGEGKSVWILRTHYSSVEAQKELTNLLRSQDAALILGCSDEFTRMLLKRKRKLLNPKLIDDVYLYEESSILRLRDERSKYFDSSYKGRLTEDQTAKILRLYNAGGKVHTIAKALKLYGSTVRLFIRSQGLLTDQRILATDEQRVEVIKLHRIGLGAKRIAQRTGLATTTIRRIIKASGNTPHQSPWNKGRSEENEFFQTVNTAAKLSEYANHNDKP